MEATGLDDLINDVHRHILAIREQCYRFCCKVNEYAEGGMDFTEILGLPKEPVKTRNEYGLTVLLLPQNNREWDADERLMGYCFRLAAVHDRRLIIYDSQLELIFWDEAQPDHFDARALAEAVYGKRELNQRFVQDLALMWEWVKPRLDRREPGQAGEGGQVGETAEHVLVGRRSKPMSKAKMMRALKIDSPKTFKAWVADKDPQKVGNRQTWTICLERLDPATIAKLERA